MLSWKTVERYERDNSELAAAVLRNPQGRPKHIRIWAALVRLSAKVAARRMRNRGGVNAGGIPVG